MYRAIALLQQHPSVFCLALRVSRTTYIVALVASSARSTVCCCLLRDYAEHCVHTGPVDLCLCKSWCSSPACLWYAHVLWYPAPSVRPRAHLCKACLQNAVYVCCNHSGPKPLTHMCWVTITPAAIVTDVAGLSCLSCTAPPQDNPIHAAFLRPYFFHGLWRRTVLTLSVPGAVMHVYPCIANAVVLRHLGHWKHIPQSPQPQSTIRCLEEHGVVGSMFLDPSAACSGGGGCLTVEHH